MGSGRPSASRSAATRAARHGCGTAPGRATVAIVGLRELLISSHRTSYATGAASYRRPSRTVVLGESTVTVR
jgi:hypothetical protein